VTNGHLDVIGRASRLYDEVVVAVLVNRARGAVPIDERIALLEETTAQFGNVRARRSAACSATSARAGHPRGDQGSAGRQRLRLRAADGADEHRLSGVETLFVTTNPEYSFLSSSLIKEVAAHGETSAGSCPRSSCTVLTERIAAQG
jgi:pantetheine-phosphate adenylyltransferase